MRVGPPSTHRKAWPQATQSLLARACVILACSLCVGPGLVSAAPEGAQEPQETPARPEADQDDPAASEDPTPPREVPEALGPEPADPNDSPYSHAPNGQLQQWAVGAPHGRHMEYRSQRRVALTVGPIYSVLRWPSASRGSARIRGAGALLELDARLLRFLWARLQASYATHPVEDVVSEGDDGSVVPVARAGRFDVTHAGAGLVYALDLGRFLPLIDGGIGLLWMRQPQAVQDGQMGGSCYEDTGLCEAGLRCGAAGVCEPVATPMVNAGIGVDVLLGRYWHVGVHVRYFALLANPAEFPVYYTGALRFGARF